MLEIRQTAKEKVDLKQSERKARFDKRRCIGQKFKIGNHVLVRTFPTSNQGESKKLLPKYSGPYEIVQILDHDRYIVEDIKGSSRSQRKYRGVVSLDKLKAFEVEVSSESEVDSGKS